MRHTLLHLFIFSTISLTPILSFADVLFSSHEIFPNANLESKPVIGDLDGDGDYDLLVTNSGMTVDFLRNNGTALSANFDWNFALTDFVPGLEDITIPVYSGVDAALGDLDNDGDLDLVMVSWGFEPETVFIFVENTGTAMFPVFDVATRQEFDIGVTMGSVDLGDLNGDGTLDLLFGDVDQVSFLENTGTAEVFEFDVANLQENFIPGADVGTYTNAIFADMDGNGTLDILCGDLNANIYFHVNNGDAFTPSFDPADVDYYSIDGFSHNPDVTGRAALAAKDMDNDGDLDLVVGARDGSLSYAENLGDSLTASFDSDYFVRGSYANVRDLGEEPDIALADMDGDGDLDLMVARFSPYSIGYIENTGDIYEPIFDPADHIRHYIDEDILSISESEWLTIADLDGDEDNDLVIANFRSELQLLPNLGDRYSLILDPATFVDFGETDDSSPVYVDIDNDGDLDFFAVVSDQLLFIPNSGDAMTAVFDIHHPDVNHDYLAGLSGFTTYICDDDVEFGDVDGDGDLDIFVGICGLEHHLIMIPNTGTAETPAFDIAGATTYYDDVYFGSDGSSFAISDLNNDGDLDLIIASPQGGLRIVMNLGEDMDGDGYTPESGDCDDSDGTIHPGAIDICDGIDNNCNGKSDDVYFDQDSDGIGNFCDDDVDGDGIPNDSDNCPRRYNPGQGNIDGDALGNLCDPDPLVP